MRLLRQLPWFVITSLFVLQIAPPIIVFAQTPPAVTASIVKITDTSQFSPPSPDPAGITYLPQTKNLLISDSEVDEMTIFTGKNLFETALDGILQKTASTFVFSREPTGVAFDLPTNTFYFSDDDKDQIYSVNPGSDNQIGTPDDTLNSFSTTPFGATDLEGLAVAENSIFIAGGIDKKVFQTTKTGLFMASFDVGRFGILDFEGIAYHPQNRHLYILSRTPKMLLETSLTGDLINRFDISKLGLIAPADLTFAPSSNTTDDPQLLNIYLVDRRLDNNNNPHENDGKMYEISLNYSQMPTPTNPPPSVGGKQGDANGDGLVDGQDYVIWLNNYNTQTTGADKGDFDANGIVDGLDYVIWLNHYNR